MGQDEEVEEHATRGSHHLRHQHQQGQQNQRLQPRTQSSAVTGSTKCVLAVLVALAVMLAVGGAMVRLRGLKNAAIGLRAIGDGGGGGDGDRDNRAERPVVVTEWESEYNGEEAPEPRALNLTRCYSSAEADPANGRWRSCERGIEASPVGFHTTNSLFSFLRKCDVVWNKLHKKKHVPRPYWQWEPDNCSLDYLTAESFCSVMEGRKGLLLVGDSLTRLLTTTLASALRARLIEATQTADQWSACNGKVPVQYIRNDYLDHRTKAFKALQCETMGGQRAKNALCVVFADDGTLRKFDTLVVNSGAHLRGPAEYKKAMLRMSGDVAATMRRLHGDGAFLVFRNTVPGHWDCTSRQFEGPVERSFARALVAAAPAKYGWPMFRQNNLNVEGGFIADGWKLLDAYTPTVLRADSHIGGSDCLHYCVPGPADHWATLLYNMLLADRDRRSAR